MSYLHGVEKAQEQNHKNRVELEKLRGEHGEALRLLGLAEGVLYILPAADPLCLEIGVFLRKPTTDPLKGDES